MEFAIGIRQLSLHGTELVVRDPAERKSSNVSIDTGIVRDQTLHDHESRIFTQTVGNSDRKIYEDLINSVLVINDKVVV